MNVIERTFAYFMDGANWQGNGGILGRYLFDGLAVRDYPRMLVATLLVALLAFAVDALMGLVQRALTPAGLTINRKKA